MAACAACSSGPSPCSPWRRSDWLSALPGCGAWLPGWWCCSPGFNVLEATLALAGVPDGTGGQQGHGHGHLLHVPVRGGLRRAACSAAGCTTRWGFTGVYQFGALAALVWAAVALGMRFPGSRQRPLAARVAWSTSRPRRLSRSGCGRCPAWSRRRSSRRTARGLPQGGPPAARRMRLWMQ